jgi:predicted transposase YdaD
MTIFPHDEFAKSFLENLLSRFGKVEPALKIAAEVREVDVYFIPSDRNLGRKDGVQKRAIQEVNELPKGHPYRQNTLELLSNLKVTLESQENIQPEDRDLIMQLSPLYLEQIQAAKQEGKQEGKQEDRQEIALRMLRKNMPLETIAELTELNIEQLQVLRSRSVGSAESQLENS